MNKLEQQLLAEESGDLEARLVVRTRTRVDAGRWWWPAPLWLCVVGDELLILAVARRRYLARLPLVACVGTHYCHTTGELVVAPEVELTYNRFRIKPREALELLSIMGLPAWDAAVADGATVAVEPTAAV